MRLESGVSRYAECICNGAELEALTEDIGVVFRLRECRPSRPLGFETLPLTGRILTWRGEMYQLVPGADKTDQSSGSV